MVASFTSRTSISGPLFDGRAQRIVEDMADDGKRNTAQEADSRLRSELNTVLRHPTGYYESHVRADPAGDRWKVHDSGIIYGPWLTGSGSRNRTTRFKGYFHWRRVAQSISRDAKEIFEKAVDRHIRRLG